MFPTLNEATAPMTYISKNEPISSHPHLYKSIMQSHDASLIENSNLFHPTLMCMKVLFMQSHDASLIEKDMLSTFSYGNLDFFRDIATRLLFCGKFADFLIRNETFNRQKVK